MLLGRYNNEDISKNSGHPEIFSDCQSFFLIFAVLVCQQVDFSNNLASKFLISALSSVAVATATPPSSALK